jgi:hypothetical protein
MADHSISVISSVVEYSRMITSNVSLDAKISGVTQNGNGVSSYGLSDMFVNSAFAIGEKTKISVGIKVPLHNANSRENSLPLPMDYQPGLGTFDVFAGVGYSIQKLQLTLAFQQPLVQNKNEFISELYPEESPFRNFQSTNKFQRSSDVLLRVSYPFELGQKWRLTPSILPIYHLFDDKFTDSGGVVQKIQGSAGLTLNLNAFLDYNITEKSGIQFSAGMPLLVRETRPDGLTRSFIASLEYKISF